ncbi:MAG: FumA C-terminus/TtdB family hydratase beta subunit [Nitrososphaerota archaeon]|nr:FumA C-terminus/TtdB family hydratase beta subunit [Candidatus Bathyarchaeota archaeon]MDW8049199.1 FumA C-terminus/TtdB family hydratase beta subunit [Nitrososphaerota archaeon]
MKTFHVETPISEQDVRGWRIGDIIYVTGLVVTARDAAHKRIVNYLRDKRPLPISANGLPIFHCGPLAMKVDGEWRILAAGPTTSMRMDSFEPEVIRHLSVRLVIGKGGMGERTRKAMKEYGAAYAAFTGGAGALAASFIKRVVDVEWLDLGMPEALWTLEVEDFGPLIIGIDSHGGSLFENVQSNARRMRDEIIKNFLRVC